MFQPVALMPRKPRIGPRIIFIRGLLYEKNNSLVLNPC
jgi:hypothetical protein